MVSYMEAGMQTPTQSKLAVDGQCSGASTPSISEGSPYSKGNSQGHLRPSFALPTLLQGRNAMYAVKEEKEAKQVMGRYALGMTTGDFLGEGSFSICRRGIDSVTGDAVAIKVYNVIMGSMEKNCASTRAKFIRQVKVLENLQEEFDSNTPFQNPDKFFVRLLDYSRDSTGLPGPDPSDDTMYVVTELADHSLKDYLRAQRAQGSTVTPDAVRRLAHSIILAVAALHEKGYVHLDLKPENIMLFNGCLKIVDVDGCVKIGSKISIHDSSSSFSPCYCAPELACVLLSDTQTDIVATPDLDAWSVGLMVCECVTLTAVMSPAFAHFRKIAASSAQAHVTYVAFLDWLGGLETSPVPACIEKFDAGLWIFLSYGLLACDPDQRLTPTQCLYSQYLSAA